MLAIADNDLNVTAAADRLGTSQPGVSKQLKLLEDELGFQIFARKGRCLTRITPAGHDIIARAGVIVRETDVIRSLCRRYIEEERRDPPEEGPPPMRRRARGR